MRDETGQGTGSADLGATEREILLQRQKKAEALRALGVNPFGNGYAPAHATADLARRYGDAPAEEIAKDPGAWSIAGRVLAVRSFGKAAFLRVRDAAGEIQVWVKKDKVSPRDFEVFKLLDVGDVVAAEGGATRTKTGELTVEATRFTILTKALRPLPEKWHGLTDVEQRYRQRYVDLVVTPGVRETFRKRTRIVSTIRSFLDARGYLEVETPTLHKPEEAGGAAARPFETFHNALEMPLKLRIATELHLKRLVVGGFDRVYEIGRIFRNEGISRRHNPEFTTIEFYQAYATHEDLMKLTEELFHQLAVEAVAVAKGGTLYIKCKDTKLLKGDMAAEIRNMKQGPGEDMAILGSGSIVSQLTQEGLIDEYQMVVNPVVLGKGRTLFEGVEKKLSLKLAKSRAFGNGNVWLCYEPMAGG